MKKDRLNGGEVLDNNSNPPFPLSRHPEHDGALKKNRPFEQLILLNTSPAHPGQKVSFAHFCRILEMKVPSILVMMMMMVVMMMMMLDDDDEATR